MARLTKHNFSDLYEMGSGISSTPEQAGHGAPFVSFSTVFNNYFLPEELPDLMDTSDREKEIYSVREGDIFLTRTSETLDELGLSAVAIKDYPNSSFSGFLKRLRPKTEGVTYHKFMAFYLRSYLFRKTMDYKAVMTLRASLNEQIFSYLELLLPDYDDQVKIGDFLYLIYEKIKLNLKINATLEAKLKLIYDYWFLQFDFPNSEGMPYKSSGGSLEFNEVLKRQIPKGWEAGTLEALGTITGGSTPKKSNLENFCDIDGTPWITPKDLSLNKEYKFITRGETNVTEKGLKDASLKLLPKGTVLLSSRAPVGYMAIARDNVTTNQGFKSFVPDKGYPTEFIYYCVQSVLPTIASYAGGSTFNEIPGTTLKTIKIPLPEPGVIEKFANLVGCIFKKQDVLELEIEKLMQLRDWAVPLFINAQIDFNDLN